MFMEWGRTFSQARSPFKRLSALRKQCTQTGLCDAAAAAQAEAQAAAEAQAQAEVAAAVAVREAMVVRRSTGAAGVEFVRHGPR